MFETAAWLIIAGVSLWGFIGWTAWYHEYTDRYQHHNPAGVAETPDEDPRGSEGGVDR